MNFPASDFFEVRAAQQKADAILAAAAPELLAALRAIVEACEPIAQDAGHADPFRAGWGAAHAKIGQYARAAIAKATGEI